MPAPVNANVLRSSLQTARKKTDAIWLGLKERQLTLPLLPIVNPVLWEVGHVAWFQEYWVLRHQTRRPPQRANGDALYDSSAVEHDLRWSLPLPNRQQTRDYMQRTLDLVLEVTATATDPYFLLLSLFHEDMHAEAMTYTHQTVSLPVPAAPAERPMAMASPPASDIRIPDGVFTVGSSPDDGFVFDNEKCAHPMLISAFDIADAPVTNREFLEFVEADGYQDRRCWADEAWEWRAREGVRHPIYWRRASAGWDVRLFDRWQPLELDAPLVHVNAWEADSFCRWAGRRLPSEFEWEAAARSSGAGMVWGLPNVGLVWEWTASRFLPYPGFSPDPYTDYSQPWFASPHRVLRGGSWATPARLMRPSFRNFYQPHRRDIYAGFRTCSLLP
ncbi:MAG TPA: selenoneine synthase SenA [Thermoanaerobaculia bacterium]|nr:selenoneine synthase SenA [Thermoanaerobaculia bacterium]